LNRAFLEPMRSMSGPARHAPSWEPAHPAREGRRMVPMTSSPADWTNLFLPRGCTPDELEQGVDIVIEDDEEVTEGTDKLMVAMPASDDESVEPLEDVTDSLEPLDPELESDSIEAWPKTFEEHLEAVHAAIRKNVDDETLALFGLTRAAGCENTAAAIAKAWEDLDFWEPMLEMGRSGDFTGHLPDLRKCMAPLEAHPPPIDRPEMLERWEGARNAVRRNLPGMLSAAANDIAWQQKVARGRNARVTMFKEDATR